MTPARSFRDPAGQLHFQHGRVFRLVNAAAVEELRAFLRSEGAQKLQRTGSLVRTVEVPGAESRKIGLPVGADALVLEHERVAFPSYPYEWPPEMLHAAGRLTLELSETFLARGFGLKDGTPYNVLFKGPEPVFVDLLSFERREPGDPIWLPEAQFTRTFLLPLLAYRRLGMNTDSTLGSREGLEPEAVYRWLSPVSRLNPLVFSLVSMPTWLGRWGGNDDKPYRRITLSNIEKAAFILRNTLGRLQRALDSLEPARRQDSVWSGYMAQNSYSREHMRVKEEFVGAAVREFQARRLLDVGCNTGTSAPFAPVKAPR
jgi:hypothetical protein